jgi:phage replication initiation protein
MDDPNNTSYPLAEQENVAAIGSGGRTHAQAAYVLPNDGGTSAVEPEIKVEDSSLPRLVTRGESLVTPHPLPAGESYRLVAGSNGQARLVITPLPKDGVLPFAALTDWLNLTFPFEGTITAVSALLKQVDSHLGSKLGGMTDKGRGMHGYKYSFDFDGGGAKFAFGGQRGTALLSLPGTACALIPDWEQAFLFFRDLLKGRISRWDGAVDDFQGQYTVDLALEWYLSGRFGTGGNKPSMRQAGNWAQPDGCGRTLYIGRSENGKMLRVYEKGKQLGDKLSSWVRWEVQFGNRDRNIPLDVLINPGPYVAAAYDCMGWISEEACRIRTITKTAQISYGCLQHHASVAYGALINVMMDVEGSAEAVVKKLRRSGVPKRLQMPDLDIPLDALIVDAEIKAAVSP